ncbi:MAG: M3 family oligoendopeptidase [Acidobacteriota bacterium]
MNEHSLSAAAAASSFARSRSAPAEAPYEIGRWDLSELLPEPSTDVINERVAEIDELVARLEAARQDLDTLDRAGLLELMRIYEQIDERLDVLTGYSSLWFSSDTQDSKAIAFRNRMRQIATRIHNRVLFFGLWWKQLDEVRAAELLPSDEENADMRHYLETLRRFRPHTLAEREEQIVNIKDSNGIDAVVTLYSMLTNRYEFEIEIDGETKSLTEEEMRANFFAPDPALRARTYRTLFSTYEREKAVLAQIYANRVRDWHSENVELRGYSSPIAVRNLYNDVADEAVATMLEVVAQNAGLFQDYFRLKAKWLGLAPYRRYDIYAPLATSARQIPYAQAVASVLETFQDFDAGFAAHAERVFRERHIDSEIRKGKRGGAFCATVTPHHTPYVHMNYTGRVRDVATLSHELGHAVHSMLAESHSVLTQHPPLPLAETASVFAEMLMTDRMLANESDPLARRELLAAAVDDIYATVMRQTFFVRFEVDAHAAIVDDQSADELFELYAANLREQFGDAVEVGDEFRYEWLSIPHIFNTPFYCYAYSFGQLLVLALYRRYQEQGSAFTPGYLRLLSYGGSRPPAEALAELDIDITDAAFWQGGFDVVASLIDELRELE